MADGRPEVRLRRVAREDAAALARLYTAQQAFLAPFDPIRPAAFYTPGGQLELIEEALRLDAADRGRRFVIVSGDWPVGVIAVSNVVRGAFQSGTLGYFVGREWNGQGIATHAVALACEWAFGEARLHRLEAGTLVDNVASQRVLRKNDFQEIGVAARYLCIAGEWRDHVLFSRIADERGV